MATHELFAKNVRVSAMHRQLHKANAWANMWCRLALGMAYVQLNSATSLGNFEPPDEELVAAAADGDRIALTQLLQRHGWLVRQRLSGRIDARWRSVLSEDDVMQETYADALLSVRSFHYCGPDSFFHWLSRIAENNLRDAIRGLESLARGGQFRRLSPLANEESSVELLQSLCVTFTTGSQDAMRNEAEELLRRALTQLPSTYREVVRRYDLAGEPAETVAHELGCSIGAMYMRRNRALELLRELLGSFVGSKNER